MQRRQRDDLRPVHAEGMADNAVTKLKCSEHICSVRYAQCSLFSTISDAVAYLPLLAGYH